MTREAHNKSADSDILEESTSRTGAVVMDRRM
jgi:hypothetical protein